MRVDVATSGLSMISRADRALRPLIKTLVRPLRCYVESRIGPVRQLLRVRRERRTIRKIDEAIDIMERRWAISATHERGRHTTGPAERGPIFILAAGWRSGSTLLQRLICSDGRVLVWGEPYDHCDFIRSLAEPLTRIREDYPPDEFIATSKLDEREAEGRPLSRRWIANLYPEPSSVLAAHRAFMTALFASPAEHRGYSRWGLKEVRLSLEHAIYLKWVFPDARFVFLYRNPYDAYRSFRPCRGWYDRFPDRPILTPRQFGAHWRRLCAGFVSGHQRVGGLVISYEELIQNRERISDLDRHLDLRLDRSVLDAKVGSSREKRGSGVPAYELRAVERVVEPLASSLGYQR